MKSFHLFTQKKKKSSTNPEFVLFFHLLSCSCISSYLCGIFAWQEKSEILVPPQILMLTTTVKREISHFKLSWRFITRTEVLSKVFLWNFSRNIQIQMWISISVPQAHVMIMFWIIQTLCCSVQPTITIQNYIFKSIMNDDAMIGKRVIARLVKFQCDCRAQFNAQPLFDIFQLNFAHHQSLAFSFPSPPIVYVFLVSVFTGIGTFNFRFSILRSSPLDVNCSLLI